MKTWRRRLRFSVGALLLVMTTLALALGLVARRKQLEQDAIAAVAAAEGAVLYQESSSWMRSLFGEEYGRRPQTIGLATNRGRRKKSGDAKATAEVLAQLKGLPTVEVLDLSNNPITDEQLVYVKPLRNLKTLFLFDTNISGEGLAHLAGLKNLASLHLSETSLSDDGAGQLGKMTQLTWLSLERTQITDASIDALSQLTTLRELALTGTAITAAGAERLRAVLPRCKVVVAFGLGKIADEELLFAADEPRSPAEIKTRLKHRSIDGEVEVDATHPDRPIVGLRLFRCTLSDAVILDLVRDMPKLRTLILRDCVAGDALLAGVESLPELTYLELVGCQVTDDGLNHLTKFPALVELYLNYTGVTDEGLTALTRANSLLRVSLEGTKTTRAGAAALRKSMPGREVYE